MKFSRNRLMLIAIALVAVTATAFFASGLMTPPEDLDLSRSKETEHKIYTAAIAPEKEPLQQGEMHNWVLTVSKPNGKPVEGAKIVVDGGMPQHHHGLPTSPQVTSYLGQGRYRVEGVKFNMSGWWVLRFAISSPAGADEAVFNLTL